jgi:signal-transduction protein with cAMP-binding, CBS, and nucleotidyltransferase domain
MIIRTVRDLVADRPCVTIAPSATTHDAAVAMTRAHVGALGVVEDGRLVGIFTERDLMVRVVAAGRTPSETSVAAAMTARPRTVTPDATIFEAQELMATLNCRHVPVEEGGRIVGMVSMRDVPLESRLMRQRWHAARNGQGNVGAPGRGPG